VVASVDINPGEPVRSGEPLLTLADMNGWQIRIADMTELDVVRIASGSEVAIQFDVIPNEMFTGVVTEIALTPGLSEGRAAYEVVVGLDPVPELQLRWGMTAVLNISTSAQ
jgi:HlyD family secretion protein